MDYSRESAAFVVVGDAPSFDDLKVRGDCASQALHETIEECRQLRQTLLYSVASNRRSVTALWQARVLALHDSVDREPRRRN